jgi:hypothetical protein
VDLGEKHGAFRRMQGWFCEKMALDLSKCQAIARRGLFTSPIKILHARVIRAQYFTLGRVWF